MATTRAQAKREAKAERDSLVKELRSDVRPNPIYILLDEPQEETWNLGEELDDTIFHGGREKLVQSRSQKREGRRIHRANKVCSDPPVCMQNTQDISVEELRILQETDPTLGVVRKAVDKKESTSGVSFVIKDGLMYRVVMMLLGGDSEPYARDQLVLPRHLGKNKTTDRVLQRFYWPTLRKDVADFVKRCETCQKTSRVKPQHAPLIPLSIVEEPFQRIAMDIVGPLPRSSSGNRYILVVCDYATRYPETMHARSAEEEEGILLREFLSNSSAVCTSYWSENLDVDDDDEIPVWNGSRAGTGAEDSPQFRPHLTKAQRDELDALLCELSAVMSNSPGKTNCTRWAPLPPS